MVVTIHEAEYYAHDGTDYIMTMGEHTYVDTDISAVSTGVMPLTKEFYSFKDGIVTGAPDFIDSIMKIRPNRNVEFSCDATSIFGTSQGNANITMDGSINSVSTITGLNIHVNDRLKLKSYTSTEILALGSLTAGEMVYNSSADLLAYYDGTNWRNIAQGAIIT